MCKVNKIIKSALLFHKKTSDEVKKNSLEFEKEWNRWGEETKKKKKL